MIKVVILGDVCEFLDYKRRPITAKDRVSGQYPYYGASGVQDYVDDYLFDDELVLLAEDGGHFDEPSRGVAYRVSGKCWVNNHAHVLKPKDNINVDYLGYVLRQYEVRPYITGAIIKKLTQEAAKKLTIPLPSLDEQIELVAIFSKIDTLRKKRFQTTDLLDQYIESLFLEMFGDPAKNTKNYSVITLKEASIKITDGEHVTPKRTTAGIKLLSARNVKNGYIDFKAGVDYIPLEEYQRIVKRCNPEYGDLLISCSGTIGRVTTVNITEPFTLVRSAALVKPDKEKIEVKYLEHYLRSAYLQAVMLKSVNQSSQANLFLGQINKIPILLPPLVEQKKFVEIVEQKELVKQKMKEQSRQFELQFQSLMQRSFHK